MDSAHRSIHPNIPGAPWYAALLIAVTATAIGYGIDAGHKELTHVFAGFYIAGCVAAVLAVRQDGIFTTIIQPPLILFCAVPGAYWLFHDAKIGRLKDLLISCGYPLIERFPLMLGTAGAVLAIGLVRWYFGSAKGATTAGTSAGATSVDVKSFFSNIGAKLQSALQPDADADDTDEAPEGRRGRTSGSSARARRTARDGRSSTRSTRSSRHARPPLDDESPERPERPRRSSSRRNPTSSREYDAAEPPRRSRRRPRPEGDPEPREPRREPRARRNPYERPYDRPAPRSSRFDGFESFGDRYDPPSGPENSGRSENRYDSREPYEPRRRRPPSTGNNGTHHPIPQVRYRGGGTQDQPREPHSERRSRSRTPGRAHGRPPAESWEYDV